MKKTLLSLFLFLNFIANAQVNPNVSNYDLCSLPHVDSFAVFDLTAKIPEIINFQNPSDFFVSFYTSYNDAQTATSPISNPTTFMNTVNPMIIYARVVEAQTGNLAGFSQFTILAHPNPVANPASLSFCDPMELAIYNLSMADDQVIAGQTDVTLSYHETQVDAETGANPVGPTYVPLVNPGVQTLYARVFHPSTGCMSITTLTLNTQICGQCPTPSNLMATNVTDTSFNLSFTAQGTAGYHVISIAPLGVGPNSAAAAIQTGASPFVFTGLMPGDCYSVYVMTVCAPGFESAWSAPLDVCLPDCTNGGNCPQALVLHAFLDSNNNGVKDGGEIDFSQGNFVYQINDSGANQYGISNNGSYLIFDNNPNNSYDISFSVNSQLSPYYSCAIQHNDIQLASGSGLQHFYFPVTIGQPHVDAQVNIYPNGQPRPGFTYYNFIYYKNNGIQPISGTLSFTKHQTVSIASVSEAGVTQTSDGFTYDFTNLAPFETRQIQVALVVPTIPTVNLGDLITNSATISVSNDVDASNNAASITQAVVGSYDPNDKTESHGGKIVRSDFTSNDYLYYTIQFENTGTASAEFIRIEDVLDNQLDENSFEMLSASHDVNTKRLGNQLTWHFYNIDLPATVSNPTGSHGYVSFRIKPKPGYAVGDIIPNTASIYFDYNPAIVTNTFNTEFVQALGIPGFSSSSAVIYPNPANTTIHISGNDEIQALVFYDISGKKVMYCASPSSQIDISTLERGVYFLEVTISTGERIVKKLMINR